MVGGWDALTFQFFCGVRSVEDGRTSSIIPKYLLNPIYTCANIPRTFSWLPGGPKRFLNCSSTGPSRLWTPGCRHPRMERNSLWCGFQCDHLNIIYYVMINIIIIILFLFLFLKLKHSMSIKYEQLWLF